MADDRPVAAQGRQPSSRFVWLEWPQFFKVRRMRSMKAARVLRFGPPSVISNDDVPRPRPGVRQLLVRVKAAGVGPWDALVRDGSIQLQPLPLVLGAELSGIVEAIGADVQGFAVGNEVYGSTNEQFSGAYAEYAV